MSLAPDLLEILVCPKCKGPLQYRTAPQEELICHACRLIYAVEDDIPIMLIDEAKHFRRTVGPSDSRTQARARPGHAVRQSHRPTLRSSARQHLRRPPPSLST